jgi:alkylation response protein AidB-like acyl-CoA dehydrogenase
LLEEVARLAEDGRFDYLVIESTGVSEPIQGRRGQLWSLSLSETDDDVMRRFAVAETFSFEFLEAAVEMARNGQHLPESAGGGGVDTKMIEAIEDIRKANPEDGADPKGKMAKLLADGGLVKLARLVRFGPDLSYAD